MEAFCRVRPENRLDEQWGFRIFTRDYAIYLRCFPRRGDYNFYAYCYDKEMLLDKLSSDRGLPRYCYSYLPTTKEEIRIDFAEHGYTPYRKQGNGRAAKEMNRELGISEAQAEAMKVGSMFNWNIPAADPKNYERKEKTMKLCIYQINPDRDENHVMFVNRAGLQAIQNTPKIDSSVYDKVYEAEMPEQSLEDVYEKFNIDKPDDCHARSLSVSDVIEVIESDSVEPGFYFCDSIGFEKVDFHPEEAKNRTNAAIRVLIVEPEKRPYVKEIDSDLESLQREVDGSIEAAYPSETDAVAYIVNEEGKINGLPLNRAMRGDDGEILDIIAGTFLVAGIGESDFCSLDDAMLEKYSEKLKNPEMVMRSGGKLHVLPMPEAPKSREQHGEER